MAETFKIDIEINAHDNTGNAASNAQSKMTAFEKSMKKTDSQLSKLTGKAHNLIVNAQDKASKIIDSILSKVKQVGSKAYDIVVSAKDRASNILSPITNKIKTFAGKAYNATISLLDRASPILSPIVSKVQSFAGKAHNMVISAVDKASSIIGGIGSKLQGFAGRAWQLTLSAVDRASSIISSVTNGVRNVAGRMWNFAVSAVDKASSVVSKIGTTVKGIAGKAWQVTVSIVDHATAPLKGIMNMLKSPIMKAGAALGVGSLVGSTLSNGMNFEAGMSKVQAISGASASDTELLRQTALQEAARTKFTGTETTEALSYMGMAGWKAQEMMDGLPAVLNLAAAGGADLATTSDIVTDAITAFGMKAKDATHFADVMAAASTNANTNVNLMGETFKYAGSLAGTLGYSIDDIALATGLMANASIKGSQAGTALRTGLVNLAKPSKEMQSVMDKYGLSLTDAEGNMKSFRTILTDVRKAFKGTANEADEAGDLAKLFGKYGLAGWAAVVNASEDDFNQLANAIDNSDGAAQRMSDTMMDNLQGDIYKFKSAWEVAQDTVFQGASPLLRKAVQSMTEVITKAPTVIKKAFSTLDTIFNKPQAMSGDMLKRYVEAGSPTTITGKLKFAWDEMVARPFSEWWNSTGRESITSAMQSGGGFLGSGLSGGIKALFGLSEEGVAGEGVSLAGAFINGFTEGFDGKGVIDAIGNAFKEHPIASSILSNWLIKSFTGINIAEILLKALGKGGGKIRDLFTGGGTGGTGGTGAYSCQTMTVTASVVNVYGNINQQPGSQNGGQPVTQPAQLPSGNGGALPPAGESNSTPISLPASSGGSGIPWVLPAAGGGAATLGGAAALKGDAAALGSGGSQLLLESGAATESTGVFTADAILGADGTVVASGGQLALAEAGLSTGAVAGMTAGIVLPVAAMAWDQSGLNPKNYTIGQQNQAAWKKSGLNPADYGVTDTKSVHPLKYKEAQFLPGDAATPAEQPWYSKAWDTVKSIGKGAKKAGRTALNIGEGVMGAVIDLFKPTSASAAEIEEVGTETGETAMNAVADGAKKSDIAQGKGSKDLGTQVGTSLLNAIGEGISGMDEKSLKELNIGENIMSAMGSNLAGMDTKALKDLNIGENLMTAIGGSLENMDPKALKDLNIGESLMNAIGTNLTEMDTKSLKDLDIGESLMNTIGNSLAEMDAKSLKDLNIGENLMSTIGSSLSEMDTDTLKDLEIGTALMDAIGSSLSEMDTDALEDLEIGTALMNAISASFSEMDTDALSDLSIGETIMSAISSSFENIDVEGIDIGSKIMEMVNSSLETVDFSQLDIGSKISEGISASLEVVDITGAIEPIISQLEESNAVECNPQINATDNASEIISTVQALVDTYGATTATAILNASDNASGTISSVSAALSALDGRSATVTVNIQTNGSMPSGAHFAKGTKDAPGGWSVINDQRGGSNATELVDQGGSLMEFAGRDVMVPLAKHAKVYTAQQRERMLSALNYPHYKEGKGNDESVFIPYSESVGTVQGNRTGTDTSAATGGINISVSVQPSIEIKSEDSNENRIGNVLRAHLRDIADDIADQIAEDLIKIFPNMPTKGEVY